MTDSSKIDSTIQAAAGAAVDGVSRRKLIRAGLASTPVLLGLKSESALATGTVVCKPSMWSSIKKANCKLSRQIIAPAGSCTHYSVCKTWSTTECSHKFHDTSGGYTGAGFAKTYYSASQNMKNVCASTGTSQYDELSRHCAAIYLNIKAGKSCPIDLATCKAMWTACKGGGTWTVPGTSVGWKAADCNEYLAYVCGKTLPAAC